MRTTRKIAVYGAGAMGTVLGAFLTKSGVEVDLISRNKAHVQALQKRGAIIRYKDGEEDKFFCIPVRAILPEQMSGAYDVIFLMTKQRDNAKNAEFLQTQLAEKGVVCTTQNGLPEHRLAEILGFDKVYGSAITFGARRIGDGEVMLTSDLSAMSLSVGGYLNGNEKLDELHQILQSISKVNGNENFAVKAKNLAGARWAKLSVNAAFSGLSVVTGLTFGEVAKNRKTKRLALLAMQECFAVSSAMGVTIEPIQGRNVTKYFSGKKGLNRYLSLALLPLAVKRHRRLTSGMLKDVQEGRKCEIDFINGVVSTLGKRYGVPTPVNDKIVEIVHGIENGLYELSVWNTEFFEVK